MRFTKRNRNKSPAKAETPKAVGTRGSPRKKTEVNAEPEEKIQDKKGTKNNRQPVKKGKAAESIQRGNKKGKKSDVPKDDKKTVESKKTENTPKEDETKAVDNDSNEDQGKKTEENSKGTGRTKGRSNPKAKAAVAPAKSKAQSTAGKKTPQVPKVKKTTPIKMSVTPPPPAANVEKKNAAPTRTSARGRKPKIIVDPSEGSNKPDGESDKPRKTAQKRKSTSKAPAEDANNKPKAAKRSTSRKSSAKGDKPVLITSLQPQQQVSMAASSTGEKNVQVTHIIEEQVVSPQVLETGASASNGIPVLQAADLLLSDTNPHRFTKMIMQPSQELPAEIFQNEQTVTVTSPQKSPKILKLVLGPQGAGTSLLHGLNPVRGPAVIVKQNTAAGDVGNPDQITCLNVFNGSPRRSMTGNDSNGENGPSTSDARGGSESEDTAVRFYNPSSPGKLVGEGLHNYCKSPLLAPAGTFPPSPTITKLPTQPQPSSKQSSMHSEAPEKKSRKRTVSSGVIEAPIKNPKKVIASPPAPVGPSPTRRSARGNAGKPPKRDSMIEIPIVNRRRSSSTNLS